MKFNPSVTVESINAMSKNTLMEHLDIECVEVGSDFIKAKMPVDSRHHQPYGLLHGGASVVLAETLGSVAAHCSVDSNKYYCVGLEINANHIRSVRDGWVYGVTTPIHLGKSTHIWEIKITNEEGKLVCISRITIAILEKK
ncbi:hotdog fold thioesterase [Fulvivirga lutea]|uniref:Hotdog fold thioesterase n=1 Tax=Fulvivirga lutea TaxID=2810512 RepID=A0A974WF63_9BACT|nr:hotdog fold thioesterase [Fulvivirga lutea]QSE96840.1 hotdog fold thioesterase [Fulvivirga lutea]